MSALDGAVIGMDLGGTNLRVAGVAADGAVTLDRAHAIGGHVKAMLKEELPGTAGVIVHMEPFEPER